MAFRLRFCNKNASRVFVEYITLYIYNIHKKRDSLVITNKHFSTGKMHQHRPIGVT